jgi:putative membrane protein
MNLAALGHAILAEALYAVVGILIFGLAFWVMEAVTPFSIRKEIEEDQNSALAILMGAVIIGLALIIAAAVHG